MASPTSLEFFCKLRILSVCNCPRLVNLVPSHLIQSFQNLKEVDVCDCKVLERVFDHRGLNRDVGILPKIEILKLEKLPRLRLIICNEDNEDNNDNMRYLLSPSKFKDFHHLKELHIIKCGILFDEKVSFPSNLEVLVIKSLPKLKEIDVRILSKLKILRLEKLPRLRCIICNEDKNGSERCLLSPSMFKTFLNLEELHTIDCGIEDKRDVYTPTNDVELSNEQVSFLDGVSYEAFESRASTFNKIMDALRDDEINLFGVVGMGGVGKTTLVKQVAQQTKQQHLFTAQLYIDVSWTRGSCTLQQEVISYIQQNIAEKLDWEFKGLDESTRAVELKQRLTKEKILIILDDIWKEIDLEKVGIPYNSDSVEENLQLRPIAIEVVEECKGLPIAIVTIAKALKDETVAVWKNSLEQLRSCAPTNIIGVDETVYSCLEWSYNHLKDLFDCIDSLEQARDKLLALVEILKASGLLLDSHEDRHNFVRMPDVVYDVAREIASKDPHPFVVRDDVGLEKWSETDESKSCTFISLRCKIVHELPQGLLGRFYSPTLPNEMVQLTNLRLLDLDDCEELEVIPRNILSKIPDAKLLPKDILFENLTSYVIFIDRESFLELKHLQVSDSPNIRYIIDSKDHRFMQHGAFPLLEALALERLDNLREVWHDPIPIGGLSQLEEMTIVNCDAMQQIIVYERESEIKEDGHAGTNLQLFPKLRSLKLCSLPQLINFSSKLETTSSTSLSRNARSKDSFFSHKVSFPNLEVVALVYVPKVKDIWPHQLPFGSFCNLQILRVYNCPCLLNLVPSHLIRNFQNLKEIDVQDCKLLEHVIILQGIDGNVEILSKLETLKLVSLPRLRYIKDGNDSMKYVCSLLTLMNIQNLKELHISNCRMEDLRKT
ncbi:Disease resistance protein RPS2 [Vitis vinifera]|uniref:Disease resistance protein RPS2 n=1 Tax=Vitis vinifera TaxID=29760 RepID=A0A438CKP1_VITVI|nr:Disease resistance protein RPS2 [Vitis vinifera]